MSRWLVVLLVVGLASVGCGKKTAEKAEMTDKDVASHIVSKALTLASGKETKVEVGGETITVRGPDGEVVMQGGKGATLPDNFPKDVPIYKGASILHSVAKGTEAFSVSMATKDDVPTVVRFYRDKLTADGWTVENAMDTPERSIQSYKKGERGVSLMVMKGDDQTVIALACASSK